MSFAFNFEIARWEFHSSARFAPKSAGEIFYCACPDTAPDRGCA